MRNESKVALIFATGIGIAILVEIIGGLNSSNKKDTNDHVIELSEEYVEDEGPFETISETIEESAVDVAEEETLPTQDDQESEQELTETEDSIEKEILESLENEYVDAEKYYRENAELLEVIKVKDAKGVKTESEAIAEMVKRGFLEYPIYTDYSIDGEYINEQEVAKSDEKHPSYKTSFASENNMFWVITMMNDCIMANPVSFNLESELPAQLIFSESENVTGYDGKTNSFSDCSHGQAHRVLITKCSL